VSYYGLTSEEDKAIIEKYHCDKFAFKKVDLGEEYVNCRILENRLSLKRDYEEFKFKD